MVHFEHAPPEARQLLPVRIRELGLSLESSPIAELVRRLYDELEAKGLRHVESGPLVRSSYHAEKQVIAHAAVG